MPTLRIQLLGGFQMLWDDAPVTGVQAPRLKSLLALLLLQRDRPHARRSLAFLFWPDSTEEQAFTNLRRLLHSLRRSLPEADAFLVADTQTLGWRHTAPFILDVDGFTGHLAAAAERLESGQSEQAAESLAAAVQLYQGDLIPDCYDEWLLAARERLRQHYIDALAQLLQIHEAQADYRAALHVGRQLLQADPLREETYRRLMHLYLLNGERAKALRVYHECASVLERELGVPPGAATIQQYERLLAQDGTAPVVEARPPLPEPSPRRPTGAGNALVGRQQEWKALLAAWHSAGRGRAQVVVITGEAGIGKTRLAEELSSWAAYQGIDHAYARAYAVAGGLAYAPVIAWLRSPPLQARLARLSAAWRSELSRLLPELREADPDLPRPQPLTESWQRQRLFEALARVAGADARPLLLWLDDLHWCDQESLEWLQYLLQHNPAANLLILGTARSEDLAQHPALTAFLYRLHQSDQLVEIELHPLDAAGTAALASQVAGHSLSAEASSQIYRYTEGNPFFVIETVRAGVDVNAPAGALSLDSTQPAVLFAAPQLLPPKIYAVIRSRLDQLSAPARALAQLLATFGRACTAELLAAAGAADEDTLVHSLDELWQRRIIQEARAGDYEGSSTYDFSHDRLRDAVYLGMSGVMRRLHHRRAAAALERFTAAPNGEHVPHALSAQLAYHHEQAGDYAGAGAYYRLAGVWAAEHYAHDDALRAFARALELARPGDHEERYQIHRLRERVYHIQAARRDQQSELATLMALADLLESDEKRCETALRQADYGLATGAYGLAEAATTQAIAFARRTGRPHQEAEGLVQQGFVHWNQGDYRAAGACYEQALEMARTLNASALEARILLHLGALLVYCGDYGYAGAICGQALAAARGIGDKEGECWALNQLAFLMMEQGDDDYATAAAHYAAALPITQATGNRAFEAKILNNTGWLAIRCGQVDRALSHLRRALEIAQATGSARHAAFAHNYLANAYAEIGDFDQAESHFAKALRGFQAIGYRQGEGKTLSEQSWLCCQLGDPGTALAQATQALAIAGDIRNPRDLAYAHTRRGYALEFAARMDEAGAAYEAARAAYAVTGQRKRGLEPLAGLARLALARGDLAHAHRLAQEIADTLCIGTPDERRLDATTEALQVYVTCYRIGCTTGDPALARLVEQAQASLHLRSSWLEGEQRARFWRSVPLHREIAP